MERIHVRRAVPEDRSRILEISSQIWDGDDYVPHVVDDWLADHDGALVVATLNGWVISFAHRSWITPRIAWFEGIRTDAAFEGRGAAKAITRTLLDEVRALGAERINLSTYIDNKASIHILESNGFQRVGSFSYLEREESSVSMADVVDPGEVRPISVDEMHAFMAESRFLSDSGGRVSHGWSFFPFDADPDRAIRGFRHRLGCGVEGRLRAAVGVHQHAKGIRSLSLGFLDGPKEDLRLLMDALARRHPQHRMECMAPVARDGSCRLLPALKQQGFRAWKDDVADVYVYELVLEQQTGVGKAAESTLPGRR